MLTRPQRPARTEYTLGGSACARRGALLDSYLTNIGRGPAAVHEMMVADLRRWIDLGALSRAADVAIVLRQFVSDYPQTALDLARFRRHASVSGPPEAEWSRCATARHSHSSRVLISLSGRLRSARTPDEEHRLEP